VQKLGPQAHQGSKETPLNQVDHIMRKSFISLTSVSDLHLFRYTVSSATQPWPHSKGQNHIMHPSPDLTLKERAAYILPFTA
jgi:hypothetical protein